MFLFLSLTFFGLPLSVSLLFFSFFLPSCLYCLLSFVSCFCLFLSFSFFIAFVSWKENIKIFNCNYFLKYFLFLLVSLSVLLALSSSVSLKSTKKTKKNNCNKTVFLWTCVLQNVKSYRFCFCLCQILVEVQKHLGISANFKSKKNTKTSFWGVIIWAK